MPLAFSLRPVIALAGLSGTLALGQPAPPQPALPQPGSPQGAASQSAPAPAAPRLRVAFVDTTRILRDSKLAKAASRQLEQTFEPRRRKLAQLGQRVNALLGRLQDDATVMSDDQRMAAQQQLAELSRRLRDGQQAFADDLNAQRNADTRRILDQANVVMQRVARQEGCEIVFQAAVYVNPRIDITDAVIRALDADAGARP